MATKPNRAIKIFYCYAPADKELRVELEKHLEVLRRPGRIIGLYDGVIQAGTELKCEINRQLYTLIFFFLSATTLWLRKTAVTRWLERLDGIGRGKFVPFQIILSPVAWEISTIGKLQVLPRDKKPITQWSNQDEALREVVQEIDKMVSGLIEWIDIAILKLVEELNRQYFQMITTEEEWMNTILARINYLGVYSNIFNEIKILTEDDSSVW